MDRDATLSESLSVPIGLVLYGLLFATLSRTGAWTLAIPLALALALFTVLVGRSRRTEIAVVTGLVLVPLHHALDTFGVAIDAEVAPFLTTPWTVVVVFIALQLRRIRHRASPTVAALLFASVPVTFALVGSTPNGCWGPPYEDTLLRNLPLSLGLGGLWMAFAGLYAWLRLLPRPGRPTRPTTSTEHPAPRLASGPTT